MKPDLLDYASNQVKNRETFLLNYGNDFGVFDYLMKVLFSNWSRLGTEKDKNGNYHTGLLLFSNILTRHAIFGFQHLVSYQSFLAWLTFRPGLEAFLILGKFVEDPKNSKIWKERYSNRKAYQKAFSGKSLVSSSFSKGHEIQKVLSRLNDDFMHPNPDFTYRDMSIRNQGSSYLLEIQFFDVSPIIHEAHLLAYLNLLDILVKESEDLIKQLFDKEDQNTTTKSPFESLANSRATELSVKDPIAKKVMQELGLWKF